MSVQDREKRAERERERDDREFLESSRSDAEDARRDRALLDAEGACELLLEADLSDPQVLIEARRAFGEAAGRFQEAFQLRTRSDLVWAIRKLREARERHEELQAAMRRELARAKRCLERRKDWLEGKVLAFALSLERTSSRGVTLPEAGVRVQFDDQKEGWAVADSKTAIQTLISYLGEINVLDCGAAVQTWDLRVGEATKAADRITAEATQKGLPEPDLPGFRWLLFQAEAKLRVVRL